MESGAAVPTYENVEPLLARSRMNGPRMEYVFRCPETGFEVTASAELPTYDVSMPNAATMIPGAMAQAEATNRVEGAADRFIPGASLAMDVARDVLRWRRGKKRMQEAQQQAEAATHETPRQLLLSAFSTVQDQFRWDHRGQRWIKA